MHGVNTQKLATKRTKAGMSSHCRGTIAVARPADTAKHRTPLRSGSSVRMGVDSIVRILIK